MCARGSHVLHCIAHLLCVHLVWQLQAIGYPSYFPIGGDSGNEYCIVWHAFLHGSFVSSTGVVVHDVDGVAAHFVNTCGVGCGQSHSPFEVDHGQRSTSDPYSLDERDLGPGCIPDIDVVVVGFGVQVRDARHLPAWFYDFKFVERPSSARVRPPSERGSFSIRFSSSCGSAGSLIRVCYDCICALVPPTFG